jgi:hypothetical protein
MSASNSACCCDRKIGRSDGGIVTGQLVGGFPHQLFYGEFSTVDDHAPLADVARCEVLRGADNRVVR